MRLKTDTDLFHVTCQDILENDSINLDWMFRYSLINDLVKVSLLQPFYLRPLKMPPLLSLGSVPLTGLRHSCFLHVPYVRG